MTIGHSTEKLQTQIEQLELTLPDLDESLGATQPMEGEPDKPAKNTHKPARRPPPAHLARETVEYATPCTCRSRGGVLRPLGEDITEIMDCIQGPYRIILHVRAKLSCRACKTITQAPAPDLPIHRGRHRPSPSTGAAGLLAATAERPGRVLAALVAVMDYRARTPLADRHLQRVDD